MATSKSVIAAIGGLAPIADYLADDYELGARISAAGYGVELADLVVETELPDYSARDFLVHQLRWARNVKDRRPAQYLGLAVTFALVWGVLAVLAAPYAGWTWTALGVAAVLRLAAAIVLSKKVLGDAQLGRKLWLLPLRDLVALVVWIVSFAGNNIEWRGQHFRLRKGKLQSL
jgi:ceramide glucosyltransferase